MVVENAGLLRGQVAYRFPRLNIGYTVTLTLRVRSPSLPFKLGRDITLPDPQPTPGEFLEF